MIFFWSSGTSAGVRPSQASKGRNVMCLHDECHIKMIWSKYGVFLLFINGWFVFIMFWFIPGRTCSFHSHEIFLHTVSNIQFVFIPIWKWSASNESSVCFTDSPSIHSKPNAIFLGVPLTYRTNGIICRCKSSWLQWGNEGNLYWQLSKTYISLTNDVNKYISFSYQWITTVSWNK